MYDSNLLCVKDVWNVLNATAKVKSHKSHLYLAKELFLSVYIDRKHVAHCVGFLSVLAENERYIIETKQVFESVLICMCIVLLLLH